MASWVHTGVGQAELLPHTTHPHPHLTPSLTQDELSGNLPSECPHHRCPQGYGPSV